MSKGSDLSVYEERLFEEHQLFLDSGVEIKLQRLISHLERGELDWNGIQKLCGYFRRVGVSRYILNGGIEPVIIGLMQSAGAFLYFLSNIKNEIKITSQNEPLLGAVSGFFFDCAAEIARKSRPIWNPDYEYEEDFIFAHILNKYFFLNASHKECLLLLYRHEEITQDKEIEKRNIYKAFLEKDARLFESSLPIIIKHNNSIIQKLEIAGRLTSGEADCIKRLSNEALALVRFAKREKLGINLDMIVREIEYSGLFAEILHGPKMIFNGEAWRSAEYNLLH